MKICDNTLIYSNLKIVEIETRLYFNYNFERNLINNTKKIYKIKNKL